MDWKPKRHKHPSKARFLISAPQGSTISLSEASTIALKFMFRLTSSLKNITFKFLLYVLFTLFR